MTVYFDGVHLAGTNIKELHKVAQERGLKREWFQDHPSHPHYDVTSKGLVGGIMTDNRIYVVSKKDLLELIRRGCA